MKTVLDTVMGESNVLILDKLQGDDFYIDMYCYPPKRTWKNLFTLFQEIVLSQTDSVTNLNIQFPKDCAYNRHAANNSCPVCGKKDKVIPILYGLLTPEYDKRGRVLRPLPQKIYPGGCNSSDCDPHWYCERDQLKF